MMPARIIGGHDQTHGRGWVYPKPVFGFSQIAGITQDIWRSRAVMFSFLTGARSRKNHLKGDHIRFIQLKKLSDWLFKPPT